MWNLEPPRYMAAVSMSLDIIVKLRMYQVTGDSKYLDIAMDRYSFFVKESGLISKIGLIYDGCHYG